VRRLLQLPQVLRQAGHGGGGVEHDLRAVQTQRARALGKMPVVADVDADLGVGGVEHRIAQVAGPEVELLEKPRQAVRNVMLAILAQIAAVGIDYRSGVVVDAGGLFLVDRHHDHHPVPARQLLHQLDGGAVGNALGGLVPARILLGAKIRAGEDFLHAQNLHALGGGLFDQRQGLVDVGFADDGDRFIRRTGHRGLDQSALDDSRHGVPP